MDLQIILKHTILAKDINKIFDPFFTTKLGKGGSGLGMNIVHNIVTNLMGGDIAVESKVGTTFELKLPLIAPGNEEIL